MQNERLQVLKMVEDGKISVDEATKLLEALHMTGHDGGVKLDDRFKDFAADMKEFAKDVTCKINELTKKAQPKIQSFTKTAVAKTADLAEKISQSLNERINRTDDCCVDECCADADACECESADDNACCGEDAGPCCCDDEKPNDNGPRPE